MPELPEVETVVNALRPLLAGRRIVECDLRFPGVVRHPAPEAFVAGCRGRVIADVTRRGKYILIHLEDSSQVAVDGSAGQLLVCHLGMTGQLLDSAIDAPFAPHTHAVFTLDDRRQLRYRDVRRFGRLLLGTESELVSGRRMPALGPEPLEPDFTAADLYSRLRGRRAPLKSLLLDQSFVAGVGNIYADESCFRARVRPDRPGSRISRTSAQRLHAALRTSLMLGISNRGSSVRDYVGADGEQGSNQYALLVYGRGGKPCTTCGRPLRVTRLAGRTTVYCARCQR